MPEHFDFLSSEFVSLIQFQEQSEQGNLQRYKSFIPLTELQKFRRQEFLSKDSKEFTNSSNSVCYEVFSLVSQLAADVRKTTEITMGLITVTTDFFCCRAMYSLQVIFFFFAPAGVQNQCGCCIGKNGLFIELYETTTIIKILREL